MKNLSSFSSTSNWTPILFDDDDYDGIDDYMALGMFGYNDPLRSKYNYDWKLLLEEISEFELS